MKLFNTKINTVYSNLIMFRYSHEHNTSVKHDKLEVTGLIFEFILF